MSCHNETLLDSHNISANTSSSRRHSARNSTHTSKFFFPFRLKDITQEILDAENEPLKEITLNESEESNECFPETQKEIPQIVIDTKFADLGVNMLETPKKPNVSVTHAKEGVTFFSSTPFPLNCKQISTPSLGPIGKVNNNLKAPASAQIIPRAMPVCNGNEVKINNRLKHLNKEPHDDKENEPKTHSNDLEQICVNDVNYLILNQLGRGGTSVVYHCYNIVTKEERAIKKVNLESDTHRIGYLNEVNVLGRLQNSDRIIHMYDYQYIESKNTLLLVLERGESDLSKILRHSTNSKTHLPLHLIICYWMEMLYAVREIHSNGIIHADLKPANFLLVGGRLKLIDFGIATCVQDDMTSAIRSCQIGSFQYISPEALINQPSNNADSPNFGQPQYKLKYKTDVWSLGCIFYQMVYQRTPFQHVQQLYAKLAIIMNPNHQISYPALDWVPEKIIETIKSCLQFNIKDRPSIVDLIEEYEKCLFIDTN